MMDAQITLLRQILEREVTFDLKSSLGRGDEEDEYLLLSESSTAIPLLTRRRTNNPGRFEGSHQEII